MQGLAIVPCKVQWYVDRRTIWRKYEEVQSRGTLCGLGVEPFVGADGYMLRFWLTVKKELDESNDLILWLERSKCSIIERRNVGR